MSKKELATIGLLVILGFFYTSGAVFRRQEQRLEDETTAMSNYGEQLQVNLNSTGIDSVVLNRERELLLQSIEERLVAYLYRIPDYSYIPSLEAYLEYAPTILEQIPSAVPLEKGGYWVSSDYGIRKHPISQDMKEHFGIDLAAVSDTYVYASADGTVLSARHSKKGYGTHIIIEHRFGFKTLYGHLNKVLVRKGQQITQHDLIGTVGTSGTSTGFHLHYEIIKNGVKIDPVYSLRLKQKIYEHLYENRKRNETTNKGIRSSLRKTNSLIPELKNLEKDA